MPEWLGTLRSVFRAARRRSLQPENGDPPRGNPDFDIESEADVHRSEIAAVAGELAANP